MPIDHATIATNQCSPRTSPGRRGTHGTVRQVANRTAFLGGPAKRSSLDPHYELSMQSRFDNERLRAPLTTA
jgi:hypothetical protein